MTNGKPALRRKTVDCGSASINAVDDSPGCGRRIELATVDFLNSLVKATNPFTRQDSKDPKNTSDLLGPTASAGVA